MNDYSVLNAPRKQKKLGQLHEDKTEKGQQQEPLTHSENTPAALTLSRVWAMPSRHTFTIKPIRELLARYMGNEPCGWLDPFAGDHSPADITNDLNPAKRALYHYHAGEFAEVWQGVASLEGVLWDPPYSPRQIRECYDGIGIQGPKEDFQYLGRLKALYAPKIRLDGLAICCGWNSQGFGKTLGFEKLEILLVPHGKDHNDTIVTVERKVA